MVISALPTLVDLGYARGFTLRCRMHTILQIFLDGHKRRLLFGTDEEDGSEGGGGGQRQGGRSACRPAIVVQASACGWTGAVQWCVGPHKAGQALGLLVDA